VPPLFVSPPPRRSPWRRRPGQLPPVPPPSVFDRFELADVRLDTGLLGPEGNERARRELQMDLREEVAPWLEARNAPPQPGAAPRVLRIEPRIVSLAYVDPAVRAATGSMPGTERLVVRVRCVDAATGEVVADTELRAEGSALAGIAPLGATASALPHRIAIDLRAWLENAVAGATH
jgi:hypothetical protein